MVDKKSIRRKRPSWMDDIGDAPIVESDTMDIMEKIKGSNNDDVESDGIIVEIVKFRMMSEEGFFIAICKLQSQANGLPDVWKNRLNKNSLTIKGNSSSLANLSSVGSTVECKGKWVVDPRFGLQYDFAWARESMPSSIEALEKYLSAGRIKGIGPATAKLIVDKWGMDTFKILDQEPDKLKEIPGLTDKKVEEIKKVWEVKKSLYHLTSFFGMYGVGEVWIEKIVERLGKEGLEARVRDNPYILTAVDGIGFSTADQMAISLGVEKTNPKRVAAFLCHLLEDYAKGQGHTACLTDEWFSKASEELGLSPSKIQPIAQELIDKGMVVLRNLEVSKINLQSKDGGYADEDELTVLPCVSLTKEFRYEKSIAMNMQRINSNMKKLKPLELMKLNEGVAQSAKIGSDKGLDPSQIEGVMGVLENGISILTGGPGTGKTTTLKSVIDIAENMGWEVVLAAPTGRAAKKMEETIGRKAGTIHRTLSWNPKNGGFTFNKKNPMSGTLFVVDEASMIDNALASSWLRAIPDGARVLFVGDINQLPSVGAGSFLHDLIASDVAKTFTLTKVHRQAQGSLIGEAAQAILSGNTPNANGDPWVDDFTWITPPNGLNNEEINEFINTSISSLIDGFLQKGYNKNDIQVISPQHGGLVGVNMLNQSLRGQLNKFGKTTTGMDMDDEFINGDKVLVTKNNYEKEVFNGDMGVMKGIDSDGTLTVEMEDGKMVEFTGLEKRNLTLGYAITVHKSQGGEKPVIIMACSPSHTFSMNKNLIYTGITRGKEKVVMIGGMRTIKSVIRKQAKLYRLTGLVSEIKQLFQEKKNNIERKRSNTPR